jgi:hypothetical protein
LIGFAYAHNEVDGFKTGNRYGEERSKERRVMLAVTIGEQPDCYGPRGVNGPIDGLIFRSLMGTSFYVGFQCVAILRYLQVPRPGRGESGRIASRNAGESEHSGEYKADHVPEAEWRRLYGPFFNFER